jgi:hypothetical protein
MNGSNRFVILAVTTVLVGMSSRVGRTIFGKKVFTVIIPLLQRTEKTHFSFLFYTIQGIQPGYLVVEYDSRPGELMEL